MKRLDVTLIPWKWEGIVLIGGTSAQFSAWAKTFMGAEVSTGEHACGHAYVEYGKAWVLWLETKDVPNLAHEALHITAGVLEGRGLTFCKGSEEAYTYTMEDILHQVLTAQPRQWKRVRMAA